MTISTGFAISQADLVNEANSRRTSINGARTATVDLHFDITATDVTSSSDASVMTTVFTPQTNYELRAVRLVVEGATAADEHRLDLTVLGGGSEYLLDTTPSATVVSGGTGREQIATDYSATTGTRIMLRRGVPYLLTLVTDSAGVDYLQGTLVLRVGRTKE